MKLRKARLFGPPIRDFRQRRDWDNRNSGNSILALYNTGDGLFFDPNYQTASSYYCLPWHWMKFAVFMDSSCISASHKKWIAGCFPDVVPFQNLGHNKDRYAQVRVGVSKIKGDGSWQICNHVYTIPPLCILYVSVLFGRVKDTLLVYQPLPISLMSKI